MWIDLRFEGCELSQGRLDLEFLELVLIDDPSLKVLKSNNEDLYKYKIRDVLRSGNAYGWV